jgi:hypothetical protein
MSQPVFASTVISESTLDGGGLHTTSANYAFDNSIGGIGGIADASADTNKSGYIGQLTEVVSVTVTSQPSSINEGGTSQLSGTATMDDNSLTALAGSDVLWGAVEYPIQSVSNAGLLTASANVYSEPVGTVNGYYLGSTNDATVQVLGPYASSEIPDSWFEQYFGPAPNSQAAPTVDADGTGESNQQKYYAGFNPTNPAAYLHVIRIAETNTTDIRVTYLGANGDSTYMPGIASRTNVLEFTSGTANGSYSNDFVSTGQTNILSGGTGLGVVANMTDSGGATNRPSRFYRVRVLLP